MLRGGLSVGQTCLIIEREKIALHIIIIFPPGVALLSNAPESIEKNDKTKKDENKDSSNDVSPSGSKQDLARGSRQRRAISRASAEKRPPAAPPKSR